jgi:hypothetical protein
MPLTTFRPCAEACDHAARAHAQRISPVSASASAIVPRPARSPASAYCARAIPMRVRCAAAANGFVP